MFLAILFSRNPILAAINVVVGMGLIAFGLSAYSRHVLAGLGAVFVVSSVVGLAIRRRNQ